MQPNALRSKACLVLAVLLIAGLGTSVLQAQPSIDHSISDTAYRLLAEQVTASRTNFYVFRDADSGFNHGVPSGFFGVTSALNLDTMCIDDPEAVDGCSTDPIRVDRERITVLRLSFAPLSPGELAGLNIEEPQYWGLLRTGSGYDLRGATHVVFDVRSPTPGGVYVQFGVGGGTTDAVYIPQGVAYTTMSIPLSALRPVPDLRNVHILFTVAMRGQPTGNGGTVLLDNIRFEPVPPRQQDALGFPLSTQAFGSVPLPPLASRGWSVLPDEVHRNLTTIAASALTLRALLERGTDQALSAARLIADTFHYALHHDNSGAPLPVAPDGSVGLHNAYQSGPIALLNDQGPGAGRNTEVRLAGFSASPALCGPSSFCLVLDGASGGNNALALLALGAAYQQFHDQRYLDDARTIGNWIVAQLTDPTQTGWGGYYVGYQDEGIVPKILLLSKSVEDNAKIFAALAALAALESQLGNTAAATKWLAQAQVAGDFVMALFDPVSGCFAAGTVSHDTPPGPGIEPNGLHRGDEVINTYLSLSTQTAGTLALATTPPYRDQIDWQRPVQCTLDHFAQQITIGDQAFFGFTLGEPASAGPSDAAGIAWEGTGQAGVAMRLVGRLYHDSRLEEAADFYLSEIRRAFMVPVSASRGLVASLLQDGEALLPREQCLRTPFRCIPERVELAATVWAIFADWNINPLSPDVAH